MALMVNASATQIVRVDLTDARLDAGSKDSRAPRLRQRTLPATTETFSRCPRGRSPERSQLIREPVGFPGLSGRACFGKPDHVFDDAVESVCLACERGQVPGAYRTSW